MNFEREGRWSTLRPQPGTRPSPGGAVPRLQDMRRILTPLTPGIVCALIRTTAPNSSIGCAHALRLVPLTNNLPTLAYRQAIDMCRDSIMKQPAERKMASDDQAAREPETRLAAGERQILRRSRLRSLSRPAPQSCMVRIRGNRKCGAPALANGRCRRHGGKNTWDHELKRLCAERSARAPYRPFWGNALDAAIVAYRTQQRLLPLVEALARRSQLDPDQGIPGPGAPASEPWTSPA